MLKKDKATGKAIPYMSLPYFSVAGHTFIIDLINAFLCHFESCSSRALLRRAGNVPEQYLSCDSVRLDQNRMMVFCGEEEITLSQSEYQLLLLLIRNKGKTVTRERILQQLWDSNGSYVNDNTLTVTMKRLREKLHNPSCIKTIRSFGYRMEDTL